MDDHELALNLHAFLDALAQCRHGIDANSLAAVVHSWLKSRPTVCRVLRAQYMFDALRKTMRNLQGQSIADVITLFEEAMELYERDELEEREEREERDKSEQQQARRQAWRQAQRPDNPPNLHDPRTPFPDDRADDRADHPAGAKSARPSPIPVVIRPADGHHPLDLVALVKDSEYTVSDFDAHRATYVYFGGSQSALSSKTVQDVVGVDTTYLQPGVYNLCCFRHDEWSKPIGVLGLRVCVHPDGNYTLL
jgi:hypothetical protein